MNTYKIAGLTVSFDGTSSRIRPALEEIFQLCPATKKDADICVDVREYSNNTMDDLPVWVIKKISNMDIGIDPVMLYGSNGEKASVGSNDGLLFCAWITENGDRIQIAGGVKKNSPADCLLPPILIPLLRESFLKRSRLLLHGAAVTCRNGIGIVILGISGSGKTTTALSMVRRGARLLGDDLIAISNSESNATVFGIPKLLNLRDNTIDFFKELQTHISPDRVAGLLKKSISPRQVYGQDCITEQSQVDVVYFVKVSGEKPSVMALPAAEALKRLILSHAFSSKQKAGGGSVMELCKILSSVRAYELKTGPDPVKLGEWLIGECAVHAGRQKGY